MNTKMKFKIKINAPVIIAFVALCFIATLLNYISSGAANRIFFSTYRDTLKSAMTYLRLFSHVLGHANWDHFIGNMSYILLLGPMIEEKYSSKNVIIVMAVTAFFTGIINFIFFPNIALSGASGVVFAFIIMSSFTTFKEGEIPLTFLLVFVFFIGHQVVQGIFFIDNVSNMAHIVGGIIGGMIGYALNKKTAVTKATMNGNKKG